MPFRVGGLAEVKKKENSEADKYSTDSEWRSEFQSLCEGIQISKYSKRYPSPLLLLDAYIIFVLIFCLPLNHPILRCDWTKRKAP